MDNPLDALLDDGILDEVVARLKSGKEADLWLVRYGGRVVVAKAYKPRELRSFRNNADYREGRGVRNSRTARAMASGSRFGQRAAEAMWQEAEVRALQLLFARGVRVPEPLMIHGGVLLMELVVDADGRPAPRLIELPPDRAAVEPVYFDLRAQMVRMLCCDLVHGDLSPYNILAAAAGPTIIDLPQVISVAHNSRSEPFFLRDFDNVLGFLCGVDRALGRFAEDGRKIWRAYVRGELSPEYVPAPPEAHRLPPRPPPPGPPGPRGPRQTVIIERPRVRPSAPRGWQAQPERPPQQRQPQRPPQRPTVPPQQRQPRVQQQQQPQPQQQQPQPQQQQPQQQPQPPGAPGERRRRRRRRR